MWPKSYAKHLWKAEERLTAHERRRVGSPWGVVEYSERGSGIPLLVSHGLVGGFDAALVTADVWVGDGLRVIGPARFWLFRIGPSRGGQPSPRHDRPRGASLRRP